jgi:hypothetical protein
MVVIHKVFRREFGLMPGLIRGVPAGDTARARVIADYVRLLVDGLHEHHRGEDDLLWPKLRQRAPEAATLMEDMEGQHHAIADSVQGITGQLPAWEASADAALGDQLAADVDELRKPLFEHLDEEEARALPVIAEHITPPEWDAIGERGRATTPRDLLPILFGAILEDATPRERAFMLKPVPFPVRILLTTLGARKYRRYVREVRGGVTA